jgi:hypothetical protein
MHIAVQGTVKDSSQAADDRKGEVLPEPDRAFVCADDKIRAAAESAIAYKRSVFAVEEANRSCAP